MTSHILWWNDDNWLYIRFEKVPRATFSSILTLFKMRLTVEPVWLNEQRAWQLPKSEMQRVAIFALETFGANSLVARRYPSSKQLSLL